MRAAGLSPTVQEQETEVPSPGRPRRPTSSRRRAPKSNPGADGDDRGRQGGAPEPAEPKTENGAVRVAVLSGGRSSEHDVSLRSGEAVARGLRGGRPRGAAGDDLPRRALEPRRRARSSWSRAAGLLGADAVFPALHGPFGEDGSVQGLLEWLDVPYVGSDVLSSAICMDKLTLKRLFAQRGDPAGRVRRGRRARAGASAARRWALPLWVKPSRLGSSVGISRVEQLRRARRRGRAGAAATTRG